MTPIRSIARWLGAALIAAAVAGAASVRAAPEIDGQRPAGPSGQELQDAIGQPADPADLARQRGELIDTLLARLEKEKNPRTAESLENAILKLWLRSGSPTIDILMEQAVEAVNEKNTDVALKLLDAVVELKPDFAEGWNKRATVYYLRDEYRRSMLDIRKVLALEPRHFGALSGLGMIMRELGDERAALYAFREALRHNPHLDAAVEAVRDLSTAVEGRGI